MWRLYWNNLGLTTWEIDLLCNLDSLESHLREPFAQSDSARLGSAQPGGRGEVVVLNRLARGCSRVSGCNAEGVRGRGEGLRRRPLPPFQAVIIDSIALCHAQGECGEPKHSGKGKL